MEKRISGHTGLMGLFGSPVGHSGSPAMYNFSFQHDELDYAYLAFDVTEEEMPKAFEAIRLFKMRAGNFTMPCKNIAAKLVDKLSPAAEIIGACNAFVNDNGVITGYITDGVGFVKNLEINGVSVKDKKIVVLGAGGAATAIQVQLALDGAKEVNIFNIKDKFYERAEGTKAKLAEKCPDCVVTVDDLADKAKLEEEIKNMFFKGELSFNDEVYITNARHKAALEEARESLKLVKNSIDMGMAEDFFSIDLMNAYESLGRIVGESVGEDLVNEIFSKFCTGK